MNHSLVSIRKRYPGQARKVMTALWGMGLMMLAKECLMHLHSTYQVFYTRNAFQSDRGAPGSL